MNVARCATPASGSRTPSAVDELALDVRQHRERQVAQVLVALAPGEVHELRVGADAVELRVAVAELLVELAEGRDLGRADEGEVLRPEEEDLPLAGVESCVDVD